VLNDQSQNYDILNFVPKKKSNSPVPRSGLTKKMSNKNLYYIRKSDILYDVQGDKNEQFIDKNIDFYKPINETKNVSI
jgi:hypothetical protein